MLKKNLKYGIERIIIKTSDLFYDFGIRYNSDKLINTTYKIEMKLRDLIAKI